jgi:hypothetical protein
MNISVYNLIGNVCDDWVYKKYHIRISSAGHLVALSLMENQYIF